MNIAIQKTLSLVLLMAVGLLLKKKIGSREELGGIKTLILSIALPATIFVALLKIEVRPALLVLPLLALGFNLLLLLAARYVLPWFGLHPQTAAFRTYWLLLPSLAPGLTCFPFVAEYLGEESLAHAALADVGNKVFVLILLYMLAMQLFTRVQRARQPVAGTGPGGRLSGLWLSLVREPINLVMAAALIMLAVGWRLESLPEFLQDAVLKMSALMTPLVLIFIGLAVRLNRRQFREILMLLLVRSGLAFCLSALLIAWAPAGSVAAILLAVAFPQSAVSFWPFAHMSAVAALEREERTFDLDLALNILALSMPFSTMVILLVFSTGTLFTQPVWLLGAGLGLIAFALTPVLLRRLRPGGRPRPVVFPTVKLLAEVGEES